MNKAVTFLSTLLTPERVDCAATPKSKKAALDLLSQLISNSSEPLSQEQIFESLNGRERLGSTGLGKGVALPHGRVPNLNAPLGAFIKLAKGIDFEAIDDQPVDLMFALLVPENSTEEHLVILSHLAEMFSDDTFRNQLRNGDAYELLTQWTPPSSA